ncbi:hypothetical protein SAMN04515674_105337 [Pseudarcicella hirudinis]|uniref:Uncharacterized protein n=1 Tax=Pseudarcicella hirudinis TaxID=1079859 RepID=A0A1I5T275_9BACT|nr:hypothetical protein [Pseudarcicella hirudinis]SFP77164.1 hypothetical protein SAMN04515674_105337 [Pseudarcicella hirudinis]
MNIKKTHDLNFITISIAIKIGWHNNVEKMVKILGEKFPDLDTSDILDEKFNEFLDGSGEIFVIVRDVKFSMPVPKGQWAFNNLN